MKIKAYMCATDWNHELPGNQNVITFPDLKELKKHKTCYKECGIVQVEIIKKKSVLKGKL